ncbi:hypothetical protein EVAR_62317_1 [Eumeta japonica]|uniref:Uncharacterized protein n=1 Tax=Eumeta variegata TaxID=151549 RepID=A0A4C1ZGN0_EUMVA|nr:hypothetical protein EVAR_62317_1 [Eumeta japonica]
MRYKRLYINASALIPRPFLCESRAQPVRGGRCYRPRRSWVSNGAAATFVRKIGTDARALIGRYNSRDAGDIALRIVGVSLGRQ